MGKLVEFNNWKEERKLRKKQRKKVSSPASQSNLQVKIFWGIIFIILLWFTIQSFLKGNESSIVF